MRRALEAIIATISVAAAQSVTPQSTLERITAEADRFAEAAPRWIATETLEQISETGASRQIVSEYAFIAGPSGMREIRRVISVDGKKTKQANKLDSLALALATDDDVQRRKMLEAFEKHGLQGVATDFGPLLLLFAHGNTQKFEFTTAGKIAAGDKMIIVLRFQQIDGDEALTIFEGGKPVKQKLRGEVWVRETDNVPLRVGLDSTHDENGVQVRDLGVVDYVPAAHGALLPGIVIHKQFRNGKLHVQDTFRYTDYRELGGAPKR